MLKLLLKRAGLPEGTAPNPLRRSFSALLRWAGVSATEVGEQMGHTSPILTGPTSVTVYDSAKREMSDKRAEVLSGGVCT